MNNVDVLEIHFYLEKSSASSSASSPPLAYRRMKTSSISSKDTSIRYRNTTFEKRQTSSFSFSTKFKKDSKLNHCVLSRPTILKRRNSGIYKMSLQNIQFSNRIISRISR